MIFATVAALAIILGLFIFLACFRRKQHADAKGKRIFISGCDSGIGLRLAVHFDAKGCDVFAGCLNPEDALHKLPSSIRIVPLDVTKSDSVQDAVNYVQKTLLEENAELWCLLNNAGVCVYGEFDWLTTEQRRRMIEVNLLGTMQLTKSCLPLLRKSRGRIVVIGSVNGFVSYPGLSVYCATKYGLEGFCDALRVELRSQGIGVVLVRPADLARLTNIMARHEEEARKMWEAMTDESRIFYGDYFERYQAATLRNYGLTSPAKFEDSPLLDDVVDAVLSRSPRARYLSASTAFRIVYAVLAHMPDSLRDKLLHYVMRRTLRC